MKLKTIISLVSVFVLSYSGKASAVELDQRDLVKIPDLLPTMYYTASEAKVGCSGKYGRNYYRASQTQDLRTPRGHYIATVCKRFAAVLLMEGSAILKDRGAGKMVVNYARRVKGQARYSVLDRCKFGQGVREDLCLLPYHTIAADNRIHKVNEVVYIPAAKGIRLPDGSIHNGMFIVRDTGGAFKGVGQKRVDLFVGTDPDYDNAFQRAGFHHKRGLKAFKVKRKSADLVRENLKQKFGELY